MGAIAFVDAHEDAAYQGRQRIFVGEHSGHVRDFVRGFFAELLGAMDALEGLVKAQPDLDDAVFTSISRALVRNRPAIRQIQLSPGAVVRHLYPTFPGDKARGLDLRALPGQREAVEEAIKNGRTITVGPVDLAQGGQAIITRRPIYVDQGAGGKFWGFATIILDYPEVREEIETTLSNSNIETAIRVEGSARGPAVMILGREEVFASPHSSVRHVGVPGASWTVAASPGLEHRVHRPERYLFLLVGGVLVFLCGLLAFWDTKRRMIQKQEATTDPLTGVLTRRAFEKQAGIELSRARRNGLPLGLIILDLDHFKSVNDTFGHAAGDKVLTSISQLVAARLRDTDVIARLGGEEFGILVPHTSGRSALTVAQRLCQRIGLHQVSLLHPEIMITGSFGVAELTDDMDGFDTLLEAADAALYEAKETGRNKVCVSSRNGQRLRSEAMQRGAAPNEIAGAR